MLMLVSFNDLDLDACHNRVVSVWLLDWQSNCPLNFYEDGITGMIYKVFKTSPWVGWIGLNAMGHMIWVSILFCCQLYQVWLPRARLLAVLVTW